ncbi:MAG: hypothetical protein HFF10_06220 [Angelakisella sp.]|nr:hypothetical protein [Angelakisella sp.]
MKKVLALVLAVMMMATMAFASSLDNVTINNGSSTNPSGNLAPGSKIKLQDSGNEIVFNKTYSTVVGKASYDDRTLKLAKDINSENYTLTSVKYNEGKSLVESIKIIDADDQVVIKLKDDFSNTKDKKIDVEFTLKGKGKYTLRTSAEVAAYNADHGTTKKIDDKVSLPDVDVRVTGTVGYQKVYLPITDNDEDIDAYDLCSVDNGTIDIHATESNIDSYVIEVSDKGGTYATMTQDIANGDVTLEVRVYDGNSFFLGFNTDANTDIVKANPDAELIFYEWDGTPTFDATAKVYFNDADEDHYVYQIKEGRVTEVGKYDEDEGCWVVKARTLGSYVVSDTKLASATTSDTSTNNPDTGANDVVGIATALAAVALVSAAAVSLKK